jgi:hypothetical protein
VSVGRRKWQQSGTAVHNLCVLINKQAHFAGDAIRMTRWVGHVARVGEKRNAYSVLVRKSEGKRSLGGN